MKKSGMMFRYTIEIMWNTGEVLKIPLHNSYLTRGDRWLAVMNDIPKDLHDRVIVNVIDAGVVIE